MRASIGSITGTKEVFDRCAEHGIDPDIHLIPIQKINETFKKLNSGDVRFRYVIDMASLKREIDECRPASQADPADRCRQFRLHHLSSPAMRRRPADNE